MNLKSRFSIYIPWALDQVISRELRGSARRKTIFKKIQNLENRLLFNQYKNEAITEKKLTILQNEQKTCHMLFGSFLSNTTQTRYKQAENGQSRRHI